MKSNKLLMIVLPAAAVLIGIICIVTVLLVTGQAKNDRYYDQLRSARQYLNEDDFEAVVAAYEAAIEIKPENPEAYVELANLYAERGMYDEARQTAQLGFSATRDRRLEDFLEEITKEFMARDGKESEDENAENFVAAGEDSKDLTLRYASVNTLTDYCYAQLVQTYGEPVVSFISQEEGYQMRFNGLNGYAYFKNTSEYPDLVDTSTRIPKDNARPYKYMILSPSWMFISFDGYISHARLCSLFGGESAAYYNESQSQWQVAFSWNGCQIVFETDSAGNIYQEDMVIEIYPQELVKADWEEEAETESESETEAGTFTLGSQTFTYDVTSIYIYGETISDLSPLANCKNLTELVLDSCTLGGNIDALAGCTSLVYLDLSWTTGFSDLTPIAGLPNLVAVNLHGSGDVYDISPIMDKELLLLHTCHTGVTYEQTMEYKQKHPNCEVWYDSHVI